MGSANIAECGIFLALKAGGPVTPLAPGVIPGDIVTSGNYLHFSNLYDAGIDRSW